MEKRKIMQCLIGGFIGGALLFSCSTEEITGDIDNGKLDVLSISSEQNVCMDIKYEVPEGYKVVFDVYAENPYEITNEGVGKKNISPIISGMTDDKGAYHVTRTISGGVQEVYVLSKSIGVPALLHGRIESGKVTPIEYDLSSMVDEESSVESRSSSKPYLFLGDWNFWGRPNYIDGAKTCDLTSKEWRTISQALPEWKKVNKDCTEIDFFGATGSRLDHSLANIFLLERLLQSGIEGAIFNENNKLYLKNSSFRIKKKEAYGDFFSLLPLSKSVEQVTLTGFKYPVKNRTFHRDFTLGISNEIIDEEACIEFADGIFVVVESKD